jgi:hypothetical protein
MLDLLNLALFGVISIIDDAQSIHDSLRAMFMPDLATSSSRRASASRDASGVDVQARQHVIINGFSHSAPSFGRTP